VTIGGKAAACADEGIEIAGPFKEPAAQWRHRVESRRASTAPRAKQ
jgi:hypothetical protein